MEICSCVLCVFSLRESCPCARGGGRKQVIKVGKSTEYPAGAWGTFFGVGWLSSSCLVSFAGGVVVVVVVVVGEVHDEMGGKERTTRARLLL